MKKILSLIIGLLLLLSLAACSDGNENGNGSNGGETIRAEKILVAYFSRAGENYNVGFIEKGNTEVIAEYITDNLAADVFKIERVAPYPETYDECTAEARREQNSNARPELTATVSNMDDYDVVFLGYPIWYGTMPMPVFTFLESYDFSGKTIIPFSTHEGSGLGSSVSDIREESPNAVVSDDAFSCRGSAVNGQRENVREWIDGLNLTADEELSMNLTINGTTFHVILDSNNTVTDIVTRLPLTLTVNRYAGHEHYAELPFTPSNDAPKTSHILAGHIYYWSGWNAFVINYIDWDIPPYEVVHIGEVRDKEIIDVLKNNESVTVTVIR